MKVICSTCIILGFSSCSTEPTPHDIAVEFVSALRDGQCEKALDLTNELSKAADMMEKMIADGCVSDIHDFKSIDCQTTGEVSECSCYQTETGETKNVVYDLIRVDGSWKVTNFEELDY